MDQNISKDFIQHNTTTPDGPEWTKQVLQMLAKRADAEGRVMAIADIVMHQPRSKMASTEWRFVDIYRGANGINRVFAHCS